jgi:hypothetical protein
MKKVAITKCDFCPHSKPNRKGVLVCTHGACILGKIECKKLLKLVLNEKESEDTE